MVTAVEVAALLVVLALLLGAWRIVRAAAPFVVNAVVGLLVLLVATWLGVGVNVTWLAVLVCAVGGVPGALLVVLLSVFDVAFAASVAPVATVGLA